LLLELIGLIAIDHGAGLKDGDVGGWFI